MERMDPDIIEKREEFREHLTLGVVKALEKVPMVQDVVLAEHQPSDTIAITSWEQRYSTMLPHEIKDFYLATDGFKLTWNFNVIKLAITKLFKRKKKNIYGISSRDLQTNNC